jgi:hypothetical protein
MTGDVTRAATGRTNASMAIRRFNEVITNVCSGRVWGREQVNSRGESHALID